MLLELSFNLAFFHHNTLCLCCATVFRWVVLVKLKICTNARNRGFPAEHRIVKGRMQVFARTVLHAAVRERFGTEGRPGECQEMFFFDIKMLFCQRNCEEK